MNFKKLESAGLETALLFDKNGDVVDSFGIEHSTNIAAMSNVIFTMCKELLEDIQFSDLKQVVLKADSGLLVGNKLDDNLVLITTTNDISKLGLLLKIIDNIDLKF